MEDAPGFFARGGSVLRMGSDSECGNEFLAPEGVDVGVSCEADEPR